MTSEASAQRGGHAARGARSRRGDFGRVGAVGDGAVQIAASPLIRCRAARRAIGAPEDHSLGGSNRFSTVG